MEKQQEGACEGKKRKTATSTGHRVKYTYLWVVYYWLLRDSIISNISIFKMVWDLKWWRLNRISLYMAILKLIGSFLKPVYCFIVIINKKGKHYLHTEGICWINLSVFSTQYCDILVFWHFRFLQTCLLTNIFSMDVYSICFFYVPFACFSSIVVFKNMSKTKFINLSNAKYFGKLVCK